MNGRMAAEHGICLILEIIVEAVEESLPDEGAKWWWSPIAELPWELTLMYDYEPNETQMSTIAHFVQWVIARLHQVTVEMGTGFEHFVSHYTNTRIWEIYHIAEAAAMVYDKGPFRMDLFGTES